MKICKSGNFANIFKQNLLIKKISIGLRHLVLMDLFIKTNSILEEGWHNACKHYYLKG